MKLVDVRNISEVNLVQTKKGLELRNYVSDGKRQDAPCNSALVEKDYPIIITHIDNFLPIRTRIHKDVISITPMGWYDCEKNPAHARMQVHVYPDKIFLKLKPNK